MSQISVRREQVKWWFGLWWVVYSLAGLGAGLGMMFLGVGTLINNAPALVFGAIFGGVLGFFCGFAQSRLLGRHLTGMTGWIIATFLVWTLFWAPNMAGMFGVGSGFAGKFREGLLHGAIFGAFLGAGQWFVLYQQVENASRWILVSTLSWAIGLALGNSINERLGGGPFNIVISVLVATLITGAGIVWQLRQTRYILEPAGRESS